MRLWGWGVIYRDIAGFVLVRIPGHAEPSHGLKALAGAASRRRSSNTSPGRLKEAVNPKNTVACTYYRGGSLETKSDARSVITCAIDGLKRVRLTSAGV
jgi:hypothetical protein